MPNNTVLMQSREAQRDLPTGQVYERGGMGVAERLYTCLSVIAAGATKFCAADSLRN